MTSDNDHPFSSFGLSESMLAALARKGFTSPSSIQAIALPRLLADSGHLIVKARTGTGKTAAFGIPLVEKITQAGHAPRALILTPTRELALQVSREIASLVSGPWPRITAVYGGASIRTQILDLKRGTEIVAGTPGRVMDLMERKVLDLSALDWFILDEADEMLDMGFFEDVEKILGAVKSDRRVALFSATMPDAILRVVREYIGDVEILEDTAPEDEKPAVDQYYMILKREDRLEALRRIIDGAEDFYGLIFCATKAGTDELTRRLVEGGYSAEAIHGDLSQEARERTLRRFRAKQTTILVATDVAARGLDIERLTHVVNWDLPNDRETYIHRIGRTGRAGRRGRAISLTLPAERGRITHLSRSMERTLGSKIVWMKVPTVKSVMKAVRSRIVASVTAVLPEGDVPAAAEREAALSAPVSVEPETAVPGGETPAPLFSGPEAGLHAEAASPVPVFSPEPAFPAGETSSGQETAVTEGPAAGEAVPPGPEPVEPPSPFLAKVCRQLVERLGADRAVEALITLSYGELLDPSRYGPVTEFSEDAFHEAGKDRFRSGSGHRNSRAGPVRAYGQSRGGPRSRSRSPGSEGAGDRPLSRVYVGLGRRHGANARDVAELLTRAGGVPGRMVDEIEMKDYCSFATLPAEAARRACSFSGNGPNDPVIRPASPARER
ncbi:MAG: DEAD/DEAH box helicase [Treponema sp.]|jgi:ATP-dependent RNA helicase DeaD|nr:DEAD/DEAH box helicase [Treponema sp.]